MKIPMYGDYGPITARMRRRSLMRLGALGRKNPMGMSPHALVRSGKKRAIGGGIGVLGGSAAVAGFRAKSSGAHDLNTGTPGPSTWPGQYGQYHTWQGPYGQYGM